MGELPVARRSSKAQQFNPLPLGIFGLSRSPKKSFLRHRLVTISINQDYLKLGFFLLLSVYNKLEQAIVNLSLGK